MGKPVLKRDFNTGLWGGKLGAGWPDDLVPLKGYLLSPEDRQVQFIANNGKLTKTNVLFNRIHFDRQYFGECLVNRLLKNYSFDSNSYVNIKKLRLSLFLDKHASQFIELERQYSARKIIKTGLHFEDQVDNDVIRFQHLSQMYDSVDTERIWKLDLPSIVASAFKRSRRVFDSKKLLEKEEMLDNFLNKYFEGMDNSLINFETVARSFRRFLERHSISLEEIACIVAPTTNMLHTEFEKSALEFTNNKYTLFCKNQFTNFEATMNYVKFWYSSHSQMASQLGGATLGFGVISSIFDNLSEEMKDKFESTLLLKNEAPPRECIVRLMENALTHQITLDKIREADRFGWQSRNIKRFYNEVPYKRLARTAEDSYSPLDQDSDELIRNATLKVQY